jgi:hypothetical protein
MLYLWQMKSMNRKYAINKWIIKINIVPEEYKSQHVEMKSHTKY